MDPRRFLMPALAGLQLAACATFRGEEPPIAAMPSDVFETASAPELAGSAPVVLPAFTTEDRSVSYAQAVAASPVPGSWTPLIEVPTAQLPGSVPEVGAGSASDKDAVVGGVRVFGWAPGRVYPVRTAPLRVTTLTLGAGETLVSKAAGDTVRWQIGETTSGAGGTVRAHVLIKPLESGLETNLVLTTSGRVYLVDLSSGGVDDFDAAVAWDVDALNPRPVPTFHQPIPMPDPVVRPEGPINARYSIEPRGRRARWTPTAVFDDGRRTFVAFDPEVRLDEAPALFVIAPDGEAQMVNYRQAGGVFIVDRLFDRAELRLGDRGQQVVRLRRLPGRGW
ncbi:TrbG/VirB9 family P-type conjugative transfer protein [Brevundimonas sp.]|uniref:TrbG/VirB9 family P-type conjugative transfer protein n=1 Tax=Brevundimonas sp. TaxID=1871086 RepID=UPI0035B1A7DA